MRLSPQVLCRVSGIERDNRNMKPYMRKVCFNDRWSDSAADGQGIERHRGSVAEEYVR